MAPSPTETDDGPVGDTASGLPGRLREVGKYRLVRLLGRGGMGEVYEAHQPDLDRAVALKLLVAGEHASAEAIARFQREAQVAARIKHPGIVAVHDVGRDGKLHYIVMELVRGRSLKDVIDDGPRPGPRRALEIVRDVARALHAAHDAGVIHRDVKPGNVLIAEETGAPALTDFGIARTIADASLTGTGALLGTPQYMAPEQAFGAPEELSPSADIYAVGAVLYELLTGRPPFTGATILALLRRLEDEEPRPPSEHAAGLPAAIDAVVMRALAKTPEARLPSAAALADALDELRSGLVGDGFDAPLATPPSRLERGEATKADTAATWAGRSATAGPGAVAGTEATARPDAVSLVDPVTLGGAVAPPERRGGLGASLAAVLAVGLIAAVAGGLAIRSGGTVPGGAGDPIVAAREAVDAADAAGDSASRHRHLEAALLALDRARTGSPRSGHDEDDDEPPPESREAAELRGEALRRLGRFGAAADAIAEPAMDGEGDADLRYRWLLDRLAATVALRHAVPGAIALHEEADVARELAFELDPARQLIAGAIARLLEGRLSTAREQLVAARASGAGEHEVTVLGAEIAAADAGTADPEDGVSLARDALERLPADLDPALAALRTVLALRAGARDQAEAESRALLEAAPTSAETYLLRALVHASGERLDNANDNVDTALRLGVFDDSAVEAWLIHISVVHAFREEPEVAGELHEELFDGHARDVLEELADDDEASARPLAVVLLLLAEALAWDRDGWDDDDRDDRDDDDHDPDDEWDRWENGLDETLERVAEAVSPERFRSDIPELDALVRTTWEPSYRPLALRDLLERVGRFDAALALAEEVLDSIDELAELEGGSSRRELTIRAHLALARLKLRVEDDEIDGVVEHLGAALDHGLAPDELRERIEVDPVFARVRNERTVRDLLRR